MALVRYCPECQKHELMHVKDGYWACRACGYEEDEDEDPARGTKSGRFQTKEPNEANKPKPMICAVCKAPLDPECLCPIHPNTL